MPVTLSEISRVSPGGRPRIYKIASADAVATIAGSGYFNAMAAELNVGDVIITVGSLGGTETVDLLVVQSNDGTTVTTTNGT